MSLKRNFIYNLIYQVFTIILPVITVPYISRVLGVDGVGLYSYTSAYGQYFILLGMIGISLYGNRQVAYYKNDKNKLSKEFWCIYTLQVFTTIISLIVYLLIFVVINKKDSFLYLIQSIPILAAIFDISWFFIGYEELRKVVVRNTITKIIGVASVFIFVRTSNDVIIYALIMGLTTLIGQIIMWFSLPNKVKMYKPSFREVFSHLSPSISLFVSQLAIQVYVLLDRTMLGIISDTTQVGLYDNAQKTIKLALTLITSLSTVMLPRMSALFSEGNIDRLKSMIYKAIDFVNFLCFPMVLGLIAVSSSFSNWFYGEEFVGIETLLKVGVLIAVPIGWSSVLGMQVMLPMKMEKKFTISVSIGAVVNVCCNFLLVYKFKAIGTTVSSVIAEIIVTTMQIYYLRNIVDINKMIKTTIKPIIGAIIMYIGVKGFTLILPLEVGVIYTIIQVIIGLIIYIFVMIILKSEFILEIKNQLIFKRGEGEV